MFVGDRSFFHKVARYICRIVLGVSCLLIFLTVLALLFEHVDETLSPAERHLMSAMFPSYKENITELELQMHLAKELKLITSRASVSIQVLQVASENISKSIHDTISILEESDEVEQAGGIAKMDVHARRLMESIQAHSIILEEYKPTIPYKPFMLDVNDCNSMHSDLNKLDVFTNEAQCIMKFADILLQPCDELKTVYHHIWGREYVKYNN
jgi:hypothetical protein